MAAYDGKGSIGRVPWPCFLTLARLTSLLLAVVPLVRGQNTDLQPGALAKQRSALYLKAPRNTLGGLEGELNHIALLSETCRTEYGAKACGLPDRPLGSDRLEDRYVYYVREP